MTVQSHSRRCRLPWAHLQHVYCWHQSLTHSSVQRTAVPQQSIARAGHETEYYTEHARELGVGRGCEHERSLRVACLIARAHARCSMQDPDKLCTVSTVKRSLEYVIIGLVYYAYMYRKYHFALLVPSGSSHTAVAVSRFPRILENHPGA